MRTSIQYKVLEEFDAMNDIDKTSIRPYIVRCLSLLSKGDIVKPREFAEKNCLKLLKYKKKSKNAGHHTMVYQSLAVGVKIGMLEKQSENPMSYDEFCNLETVAYFKSQLRGVRCHNLTIPQSSQMSTRVVYVSHLYHFNNWLIGKKFEFSKMIQVGTDSFKKETSETTVENVEHFLKLYQQSFNNDADYIKVIKKYLMDQKHEHKKANTIKLIYKAIKSYFEKNESPIKFVFDPVNNDESSSKNDMIMSLNDLYKLLTMGRPTVTQKAVFLCKFHRGLDTLTLCEQFNFYVLKQLISYFETSKYMEWDLKKCPVPITLVRIKTNYKHVGFLDVDAITAIQDYLKYREEKIGIPINENTALFLNQKNEPIKPTWVRSTFSKLATTAGLRERLPDYHYGRYTIDSHEVRDLLKSTLIASGTRIDVADHVIGHTPKDSYEKQAKLYPESMRAEYMKGSHKINIFSNVSNYLKGKTESVELQRTRDELESIRRTMDRKEREKDDTIDTLKKNQKMIFALLNIIQNDVHKPSEKELEKYKPLLEELKLYID